jgi:hypothetical protein
MTDIERTSLDAHVSLCELRYLGLANRLDQIEARMEKLELMVTDIHSTLHKINRGNSVEWIKARDVLIAVLFGALSFMVSKFLF